MPSCPIRCELLGPVKKKKNLHYYSTYQVVAEAILASGVPVDPRVSLSQVIFKNVLNGANWTSVASLGSQSNSGVPRHFLVRHKRGTLTQCLRAGGRVDVHVPLTRRNALTQTHLVLIIPFSRYVCVSYYWWSWCLSGVATLKGICGREVNHHRLAAPMLPGILSRSADTERCRYLSKLSWEDLIPTYLLVWLGSGFTVAVILISLSLKDAVSLRSRYSYTGFRGSSVHFVFSLCANRVTVIEFQHTRRRNLYGALKIRT